MNVKSHIYISTVAARMLGDDADKPSVNCLLM